MDAVTAGSCLKMRREAYPRYLIAVLATIAAFNGLERLTLGLLLHDIKIDFALSDTQLGVMTGLAFALFASVIGIPIARWADRSNRILIISISTALWAMGMLLFGMATSFAQLLIVRVGMAIGESGCAPSSLSLIADYFDRSERARAVSRYLLGGPLAALLGYFVAGWLNELYGWRITFGLLGLPGFVLAGVAWFTLIEPRRSVRAGVDGEGHARDATPQIPLKAVCRLLLTNLTFRHLVLYYAVNAFFSAGIKLWQPVFFIRSFGLQTGELGTWMAIIVGAGTLAGTYAGGEFAARFGAYKERLQLEILAVVCASLAVVKALTYLSTNQYAALGLAGLNFIGASMSAGPILGVIQSLVPERARATSFVVVFFMAALIGNGLGPLAAGVISDILYPSVQEESIRYGLLILSFGYLWAAWHVWRASKSVMSDLQRAGAR